jgi:hypothetical protein
MGDSPDVRLSNSGLHERMHDAVLGGGPQPRPPVPQIVRIRTREHGLVAPSRRKSGEVVVELGLAVVAAIAIVAAIPVALELGGRDQLMPDPDRPRDLTSPVELTRGKSGRDGGHGQGSLAERSHRQRGDERRVDPSRERDDAAPERADPAL